MINELKLGQQVFVLDLSKKPTIKEGKVCGYNAEFYAPWNDWRKEFRVSWYDDKHKLINVCIYFEDNQSVDGINEWYDKKLIFIDKDEAIKKLNTHKKNQISDIKKLIKHYEQEIKSLEN